jgi:hypothetical protein
VPRLCRNCADSAQPALRRGRGPARRAPRGLRPCPPASGRRPGARSS